MGESAVCTTHWAEVTVTPGAFDLLSCTCSCHPITAVRQSVRSHFTSQLIDFLDVFLLQGADGLEAAGQAGLELLPVAQRLAALPGLVFDAQGFEKEAKLVSWTVWHEDLDVFRDQFHGALPISGKLGEKFELFQMVALGHFAVVDSQDDLLVLIPAQNYWGFADDLPPGGLSGAVELLHRHSALKLCAVLSR